MPRENVLEPEAREENKPLERRKTLHQSDFRDKIIKPQAVDGMVITRGLAADIPDGSSHVLAYFETDTGKLKIWDGSAWLSTTLS